MNVLLINPNRSYTEKASFISNGADVGLPLGILYLAAMLEKKRKVEIIDCLVHKETVLIESDKSIEYGIPRDKLKEIIGKKKPDIVGITNLFTTQIRNAIMTADIVKEINKDIVVMIGGPHVSVNPVKFLEENGSFDIAVVGEGELSILDIIEHFEGRLSLEDIKGIAYRKDGRIFQNEKRNFIKNLDELPFPAYHLIDIESYLNLHEKGIYSRSRDEQRVIPMITSRGCPFNCVFCSIHSTVGRVWRPHSADYVIKHITHVVKEYGVKEIHFEDDNFTLNIGRCEKILEGITNLGIRWDTPNGIRADIYSRSLVAKMKESGCKSLTIGIESGSQRVLDEIIKKGLNLNKVEGFAQLCREFNIPLNAFYVIGFPGEKKEDIKKTIDLALMLQKRYGVNQGGAFIATPLYGSRLHDICEKKGYLVGEITPEALSNATASYGEGLIKTEEFTPSDLRRFNKRLIRANYIKHLKNPLKHATMVFKNPKLLIDISKRFFG